MPVVFFLILFILNSYFDLFIWCADANKNRPKWWFFFPGPIYSLLGAIQSWRALFPFDTKFDMPCVLLTTKQKMGERTTRLCVFSPFQKGMKKFSHFLIYFLLDCLFIFFLEYFQTTKKRSQRCTDKNTFTNTTNTSNFEFECLCIFLFSFLFIFFLRKILSLNPPSLR